MIDRGDLPSLVAITLAPDPGRLALFHVRESDAAADRRLAAAHRHADAFGTGDVAVEQPPGEVPVPEGLRQAQVLLAAAAAATRLGCSKIVWPHQVGPDAGLVGEAVERANMITALVELGRRRCDGVAIDLPVVDLTDQQLADLAEDGGAPMQAFWPCEEGDRLPCGACGGCRRWRNAFDLAGTTWPWAGAGAVAVMT